MLAKLEIELSVHSGDAEALKMLKINAHNVLHLKIVFLKYIFTI